MTGIFLIVGGLYSVTAWRDASTRPTQPVTQPCRQDFRHAATISGPCGDEWSEVRGPKLVPFRALPHAPHTRSHAATQPCSHAAMQSRSHAVTQPGF